MAAKHTPGSIADLAEQARMQPWDKTITDVPHSARYAFQCAITADHYMELLEALALAADAMGGSTDPTLLRRADAAVNAAIAKATGGDA